MNDAERERLFDLIRVPSVSALAEHDADMALAADMVAGELERAGASVRISHEGRHPLVLGSAGPEDGRRVIVYGHYDVQPIGEPELWRSPPFEPTVRDGYLYARGSSDDKGNLFMLLVAAQRLAAAGRLGVRLDFLIDGEEESGGTSAEEWLAADPDPAHAAVIFDAPMIGPGRPAFCVGVRGLLYRRITVRVSESDAHSGIYGGAALNAALALHEVIAAVRPRDGRVPEPLHAGVAPPSAAERAAWKELPDGGQVLSEAGLLVADADAADAFYERTTALPSVDVHGLSAGEPHAVKTNIPAAATATLSLRLAPGQSPEVVGESLDALMRAAVPPGAELEITHHGAASAAVMDPEHPVLVAAADGFEQALERRPVPVRTGGSIPIVAAFTGRGIPTVLTGFGLPDDGIHGPNERLAMDHLEFGVRAAMGMFDAL
ncbi:MAG: M20/M25/M40 family metallo-hydrolase, partial [Thermoleophilia bacterium]|nr:M20/M25/M40 family metallo-hydrolase [Thermoleophilia bacterium]